MQNILSAYGGQIAALSAAFLWAAVSFLFLRIREHISAMELNLVKGLLAIVLLGGTSFLLREPVDNIQQQGLILLLISGVIGIGIGDTAYFQALKDLGPRLALLLMSLAPPIAAIIALIFLQETLSIWAWVGIFLAVGGITWVVTERSNNRTKQIEPKHQVRGVIFGVLSAVGQATGVVMSRAVLTQTEISSLQSAVLRLMAGAGFILVWLLLSHQPPGKWIHKKDAKKLWGWIITAAFFGTYLCLWLQQISLDLAPAGIVQTLLSVSPLFVLPMAAMHGEKISVRAIFGALVAFIGIYFLFAM
jgi:drug/metabolite transporter (DMT)-like permease